MACHCFTDAGRGQGSGSEIAWVLRQKALCLWGSPAPESTAGPQIGLDEGACWACVLRGHRESGGLLWSGDDTLSSGVLPAAQRSWRGEEHPGPCILGVPAVGTGMPGPCWFSRQAFLLARGCGPALVCAASTPFATVRAQPCGGFLC